MNCYVGRGGVRAEWSVGAYQVFEEGRGKLSGMRCGGRHGDCGKVECGEREVEGIYSEWALVGWRRLGEESCGMPGEGKG